MALECGACGASVSIYDEECPYCHSKFEPRSEISYRLPDCQDYPNAKQDATSLEPYLHGFLDNYPYRPIEIDEINECLMSILKHNYLFADFVYETVSLVHKYRSTCMHYSSEELRLIKLDMFKRLNSIYLSLTGNKYLPQ